MSNIEISQHIFPKEIDRIFTRLDAKDVEQFYKGYQLWALQRQIELQQVHVDALYQKITANEAQMQEAEPSSIALSTLAQLQACGVHDVDLLDRMLERGESWLDHTIQLLERCEQLDVIRGDYTQWCENALDGAYDWIDSMHEADTDISSTAIEASQSTNDDATPLELVTEELLLQKLMSEEGDTDKIPAIGRTSKITQPLPDITAEENGNVASSVDAMSTTDAPTPIETLSPEELAVADSTHDTSDAASTTEEADDSATVVEQSEQIDAKLHAAPEEGDQAVSPVSKAAPQAWTALQLYKSQEVQVTAQQQPSFLRRLMAACHHWIFS